MREYKLITILKTFSKEEMKNFGIFISSPYFNRTRNYDRLYRLLKKYHPDFPPEKFSSEKIYSYLYPGKIFNIKKSPINIRVIFSQLSNLAEKFIVYELFERSRYSYTFNESAIETFKNRKLIDPAIRLQVLNLAQLDEEEKGSEYNFRRFHSSRVLSSLYSLIGTPQSKRNDYFKHERNNLLYFYAYLFDYLASFLNDAFINRANRNYSFNGIETVKSLFKSFEPDLFEREFEEDSFETKNLTIYNYYLLKSRLDEESKDSLLKALEYFYRFFPNVSSRIQYNCYKRLHNRFYGQRHLDRVYSVKFNELIDFAWKYMAYSEDKESYLDPHAYICALDIKSYLLDGEDVQKFINKFIEKIDPCYKEDYLNLSMAELYFKERLFGKCLEYASKKDNLGPQGRISKYRLKICSFLDEGLYEEAIYAVDSLEHYMRRNKKEIGPVITKHYEFLKVVKYLLKLKSAGGLADEAEEVDLSGINRYSTMGQWLEEKIDELNKKRAFSPLMKI